MPAFGYAIDPKSRRYAVAADFAKGLVDRIAAAAPGYDAGLFQFGTKRPGDCSDRGLAVGFGPIADPLQRTRIKDAMSETRPTGITPIGASIEDAADLLKGYSPAVIFLVTDGAEECPELGKDPCDTAAAAKRAAPSLVVHVVGLDLAEGILKRVACVAELSGGSVAVIEKPGDVERVVTALTTAIVPPSGTIVARADVAPAATFPAIRQAPKITLVDERTGRAVASEAGTLSRNVPAGAYRVEFQLGSVARSSRLETGSIDGEAKVTMTFPFGVLKVEPTLPDGRAFEVEPRIAWTVELIETADGRTYPRGSQTVTYQAPALRLSVPPGTYRVTADFDGRTFDGGEPIPVASGAETARSIKVQ